MKVEPLVKEKDIAMLLNCSVATVNRMVKAGTIPYIALPTSGKKNKQVRFDMEHVERWLRRQSREPSKISSREPGRRREPEMVDAVVNKEESITQGIGFVEGLPVH